MRALVTPMEASRIEVIQVKPGESEMHESVVVMIVDWVGERPKLKNGVDLTKNNAAVRTLAAWLQEARPYAQDNGFVDFKANGYDFIMPADKVAKIAINAFDQEKELPARAERK